MFFPKLMFHTGRSSTEDPFSLYIAQFDTAFPTPSFEEQFYRLNNIIGSSVYAQFVSLFDELYMAYSIKNAGYRLKCQSRIMDIFHLLIRETDFAGKPFSPKIEKVLGFMAEHRNVSHSVEELSRIAGLSPSHFRSLFKQTTGLSVNDYQIRSRLDQAKELLIGSDCNVTEAALAAGFTDIYYFSRLSRKKRA